MFEYLDKKDITANNIRLSDIHDEELLSDLTTITESLDTTEFIFYIKLDTDTNLKSLKNSLIENIKYHNDHYFNASLYESSVLPIYDSTTQYVTNHTDSNVGPDGTISCTFHTPVHLQQNKVPKLWSDQDSLYGIVNDNDYYDEYSESMENSMDVWGQNKELLWHMPLWETIYNSYNSNVHQEIKYMFNEPKIINDINGKLYSSAITFKYNYDQDEDYYVPLNLYIYDTIDTTQLEGEGALNQSLIKPLPKPLKFTVNGLNADTTAWEVIGGLELYDYNNYYFNTSDIPIKPSKLLGISLECEVEIEHYNDISDLPNIFLAATKFKPGFNANKYSDISYNDFSITQLSNIKKVDNKRIDPSKLLINYKYYDNLNVIKLNINKNIFNGSSKYDNIIIGLNVEALTFNYNDYNSIDDATILETLNFDLTSSDEVILDFTSVNIADSTSENIFLKFTILYDTDTQEIIKKINDKNNYEEFLFNNYENNFKLSNRSYFENSVVSLNYIEYYEWDSTGIQTEIIKNNVNTLFLNKNINEIEISYNSINNLNFIGHIELVKDSTIIDNLYIIDSTTFTSDETAATYNVINDTTSLIADFSYIDTSSIDIDYFIFNIALDNAIHKSFIDIADIKIKYNYNLLKNKAIINSISDINSIVNNKNVVQYKILKRLTNV